MSAPLFYRVASPEWRHAGLPCKTVAYDLHKAGKLTLVKDIAGRTGITAAEAQRYFGQVEPLSNDNKRDTGRAVESRKRRAA